MAIKETARFPIKVNNHDFYPGGSGRWHWKGREYEHEASEEEQEAIDQERAEPTGLELYTASYRAKKLGIRIVA